MQLSNLLVLVFSAIAVNAIGTKRQETPPPPGETYVTARPACNITGFTEVPVSHTCPVSVSISSCFQGNYTETIYQEINATLQECVYACRANSTCQSIAYSARYTECLFYNRYANEIQLWESDDSVFDHYDEDCDVCEDD